MKLSLSILLLMAATAFGDARSVGPDGINAKVTGLDGSLDSLTGVNIGQADHLRSAKAGWDHITNSAPNTVPYFVGWQSATVGDARDSHIGDDGHATEVAEVIIGGDAAACQGCETYEGVAPKARLHSVGIGNWQDDSYVGVILQAMATKNLPTKIRAIDISWGFPTDSDIVHDNNGKSVLSQFIDWSAARYDVLYVVAGARDDDPGPSGKPDDSFNAIVVGSSDLDEYGSYAKWGPSNSFPRSDYFVNQRTHVDILAPGEHLSLFGVTPVVSVEGRGTSFSAGFVTGTIALMEQYREQQLPANDRFNLIPSHTAYKAILMNSADKIQGVHGSLRTVRNHLNQEWRDTEAYKQSDIPIDPGIGAGHLNVENAVHQFASGRYQSTGASGDTVPLIAWGQDVIPDGAIQQWQLGSAVAANTWVSITLCWDRLPVSTGSSSTWAYGNSFDPYDEVHDRMDDLDLYLVNSAGNVVAKSDSADFSVEHIFVQVPAELYHIEVWNLGGQDVANSKYGLAWWFEDLTQQPGDFDGNGSVGPEDYNVWRAGFGTTYTAADYVVWRKATPVPGLGVANVPEPNALFLILSVMVALSLGREIRAAVAGR